jgi:hypothetical protein
MKPVLHDLVGASVTMGFAGQIVAQKPSIILDAMVEPALMFTTRL